jgi:putative PIN family toxin of toxin-antitoxin system
MRVFLDTNVLVSAVATRGLCADVLREVLVSHQLVISSPLLNELANILHSKFGIPYDVITEFIEMLSRDVILSGQTESAVIDIQDQDDVIILSSALSGGAELFVTGDKEILALGKIQHMEIVSPRKFWEILKT